jgi:hypothetical protein
MEDHMIFLLEKQTVYWSLAYPEVEETFEETDLTIDDFILGPFDTECLSEYPPESDWSDWFPPPQRIMDWELYELADWAEIQIGKQEITLNPDHYLSSEVNMNKKMAMATIPVPPSPVLEQAVGYENNKGARYLALWWEPGGDEAMVSDGYVTSPGHWPGYLAYVHHPSVYPHLATYNLGSSDDLAEYRLIIDLQERQAFIFRSQEAINLLASQWETETDHLETVTLSSKDIEDLFKEFVDQVFVPPTIDELEQRMEADRIAVETLSRWLNSQLK